MSGIDEAAAAFSENMGEKSAPSPARIKDSPGAVELVFGNSDRMEGDIPAGGGDHILTDEEKEAAKAAAKESRRRKREEEDDEEEDDVFLEEDDEDLDEDEDEDEEDKEFLDRKVTLMVDGEEEEVTVRDALDGIIRTKTFHKRLNQLDGYRDELGKHAEKVVKDRERYDQLLGEAEELMKGILPEEPNWDELFERDPKSARVLQKQYEDLNNKISEIRAKREEHSKDQAKREFDEKVEFGRSEFPKFQAYAKWKDRKSMQKDFNSMRRTAMTVGFTKEEVADVLDSRMLIILHKASKYDRMMAAKPRAEKRGKSAVKPGAGSKQRTARRGITASQKRLAKSGSIDDAANVFDNILKNSR